MASYQTCSRYYANTHSDVTNLVMIAFWTFKVIGLTTYLMPPDRTSVAGKTIIYPFFSKQAYQNEPGPLEDFFSSMDPINLN